MRMKASKKEAPELEGKLTWEELVALVERRRIQGDGEAGDAFEQSLVNDLVEHHGYPEASAHQLISKLREQPQRVA